MKIFFLLIMLIPALGKGQYLDNHSCKECHEAIYEEYEHSAHSRSYFSDELHRAVADAVSRKKYDCAPCHMPAASDRADLVKGKARPDSRDRRQKDGVSCFFCHTIAFVKEAHRFNLNLPARQAEGYKPSLFGSLENPDENDKHSSLKSPIYWANVCKGCHSHKLNDNNVTIFRAMKPGETSSECIRCHMPKAPGGVEKMNKRGRSEHFSHRFPGIRDATFRRKGIEIGLSLTGKDLDVMLENKMPHPLIIQPARAKYLVIEVFRDGKRIWRNYKKEPSEDHQGYFAAHFYKGGKEITIPATATATKVHNLPGKSRVTLHYHIPGLRPGDKIRATFYIRPAKAACARSVTLRDAIWSTPLKVRSRELVVPAD